MNFDFQFYFTVYLGHSSHLEFIWSFYIFCGNFPVLANLNLLMQVLALGLLEINLFLSLAFFFLVCHVKTTKMCVLFSILCNIPTSSSPQLGNVKKIDGFQNSLQIKIWEVWRITLPTLANILQNQLLQQLQLHVFWQFQTLKRLFFHILWPKSEDEPLPQIRSITTEQCCHHHV